MGFISKFLGALKNLGGCMNTPKADNSETMKQTKLCDRPKGEEETDVAKDSVNSKNDGVGEDRNIVGNQVTLDKFSDDESEDKEGKVGEVSTIQEKPYEDEGDDDDDGKEEKNNSVDEPNFGSED